MSNFDGGPAFPQNGWDSTDCRIDVRGGMTLRDYFAAKALHGMRFSNVDQADEAERRKAFAFAAAAAYELADAMLQARTA